jgi:hypothetical protein
MKKKCTYSEFRDHIGAFSEFKDGFGRGQQVRGPRMHFDRMTKFLVRIGSGLRGRP